MRRSSRAGQRSPGPRGLGRRPWRWRPRQASPAQGRAGRDHVSRTQCVKKGSLIPWTPIFFRKTYTDLAVGQLDGGESSPAICRSVVSRRRRRLGSCTRLTPPDACLRIGDHTVAGGLHKQKKKGREDNLGQGGLHYQRGALQTGSNVCLTQRRLTESLEATARRRTPGSGALRQCKERGISSQPLLCPDSVLETPTRLQACKMHNAKDLLRHHPAATPPGTAVQPKHPPGTVLTRRSYPALCPVFFSPRRIVV